MTPIEPQFLLPPLTPTLWQMAGAWIMRCFYGMLTFIPQRWILLDGRRQIIAVWVHSNAWYWEERMAGRV